MTLMAVGSIGFMRMIVMLSFFWRSVVETILHHVYIKTKSVSSKIIFIPELSIDSVITMENQSDTLSVLVK